MLVRQLGMRNLIPIYRNKYSIGDHYYQRANTSHCHVNPHPEFPMGVSGKYYYPRLSVPGHAQVLQRVVDPQPIFGSIAHRCHLCLYTL